MAYRFDGAPSVRKKLDTGDYSLEGFESLCVVERKTKEDAYGCVGASRKRFIRCLERLARLDSACIVIECSLSDFAIPPRRTKVNQRMAIGSFISWCARYKIPVWFCDNRVYAERVTEKWLLAYWRRREDAGDADEAAGAA